MSQSPVDMQHILKRIFCFQYFFYHPLPRLPTRNRGYDCRLADRGYEQVIKTTLIECGFVTNVASLLLISMVIPHCSRAAAGSVAQRRYCISKMSPSRRTGESSHILQCSTRYRGAGSGQAAPEWRATRRDAQTLLVYNDIRFGKDICFRQNMELLPCSSNALWGT